MKPANLLYILSDEHNRDSLGCYGHPLVKTPNLDRLSERGVLFRSAYTNCPICVPARASLATGRYVHTIRYWDNAFPYDGKVKGWGHRLIEAGHQVDSVGKLHYRSQQDADGFSEKILPLNVVDGIGDLMGSLREDIPVRSGSRSGITAAGPGTSTYLDYDVEIADSCCQWLEEAAAGGKGDKPWVLFASFVCPHPPFIAPPELYELYPLEQIPLPVQGSPQDRPSHPALQDIRETMQYDQPFTDEEIRRVTAAYYGACTHLDLQIGRLLDTLAATGLDQQTRIIYTSDHGESMGRRGLWGKFTMYEESVAVPLIMAGADVPRGETCDDLVTLVDSYPTILEAVGEPLTNEEQGLPGDSLWSIAAGGTLDRHAFSEYHAVGSRGASYMLRRGRYKYIHYVKAPDQLFDLESDPQELSDLAGNPELVEVNASLERELRGILDPLEVDRLAKQDQQELIDRHGGRDAILRRGTFVNSPVPGETPTFTARQQD
jgi:choline-sulfatase